MAKNLPDNWFYMAENIPMKKIKETLQDLGYSVQFWEDAGVIEVELGEKMSIDMEAIDSDLGDAYSNAFVEQNGMTSIYYISFRKEDYDKCMEVLQNMRRAIGGIICGDSEDFQPIYR